LTFARCRPYHPAAKNGECKRIRDDQGFWQRVEDYVSTHTDADFSHGLCPECLDKQRTTGGQ
jgi:hypothetical protein